MGFLNSIFLIILSITIYQFGLHLPVAAAKDVLIPGDELNTTSTLISAGGNFTLGFFTIETFTYLGIWYTNDVLEKKVWVANRDIPVTSSGSSLTIDDSGTLKVITRGNDTNTTLFNVSNGVVGSGNTRAVLKDSGNFVLYDFVNGNRTLWQSFDHPTDTLLPGMKLGYNLTTRQNWTLTSWLSDKNPASGAFTMSLEQIQNSPHLRIYWRGNIYYDSGPWENGNFRVWGSKLSRFTFDFETLKLISDASGMYFSFQTTLDVPTMYLSSKGELITPDPILTPTFCYGYQTNDGCAISALHNCRDKSDSFQFKSGSWTGGSSMNDDSKNISLSDCMERCWKDCNCNGFITTNSDNTGCMTWTGEKKFTPDESGTTEAKYVLVSQQPKKKTWIWIVSVSVVLTLVLAAFFCYMRMRRHRLQEEKRLRDHFIHQLTGSHSFNYGDELEKGIKDAPDVKIFSLRAILAATDNFSTENKLGQGGYGPVYKGKLSDGRQIAVKKLSKTSGQGIEEFKSELILISKLQHINLVRLYGCCIHQEEKMLIYEFMPNKSLDFFLFDEDKKKTIDWQIRINIIEGVAQGLLYLHRYSRMRIIHRDLKVSNVLLDENMNPKIADFGLARIFQQNMTEAVTNRVVGTYGYMAPEYAMGGTFSIKSDVFSFGVLILEIVSGKRNSCFYHLDRPLNLIGYAWELWKREMVLELKDESLGESCDLKQLFLIIHVGLLCVEENADDRPTMSDIISMLNNEITDLPIPKQPAFLTGTQPVEAESKTADYSLDKNIQVSINGLTITTIEAK